MKITSVSLILFTVFIQTAAGLTLASELARLKSSAEEKKLLSLCLPVALLISLFSLMASTTHLASPLAAVYVLNNIFVSALSLEIFCASLFTASLALTYLLRYRNPEKATGFGLLSAVLGIVLIFAIANVYIKETMPTFNTPATLLSFLGTGLLIGAALASLLYTVSSKRNQAASENKSRIILIFLAVAVLGIGFSYLGTPFNTIARSFQGNFGLGGVNSIMEGSQHAIAGFLSIALPVTGLLTMIIASLKEVQQQKCNLLVSYSAIAVVFVLAGELCGRYLFYESYLRLGV